MLHAFLLLLVIALLAWACMVVTRATGRIASVWIPNGVAIAILLRRPRDELPLLLCAVPLGDVLANLVVGDTLMQAAAFGLFNLGEVAFVIVAMARVMSPHGVFETRVIGNFLFAAIMAPLAPAVGAALWLGGGIAKFGANFLGWYVSDLLGLLIVTPVLLALHIAKERLPSHGSKIAAYGLPALACSVVILIFGQHGHPLMFSIAPFVLLATFRLPLLHAMVTLLAVILPATVLTIFGLGPIANAPINPVERIYVLQAFIATMVMLVLPVRAVIGERDRLGVAARNSERLFHRIAEASPAGILYLDNVAGITFVSARWIAFTGRAPRHAKPADWLAWVDPRDQDAARAMWAEAQSRLPPTTRELRFIHPDNGPGTAELGLYPESVDGQVRGFVVRLSDVSRTVESAARLSEANRLLSLAETLGNIGHWRYDVMLRTLHCSAEFSTLAGLPLHQQVALADAFSRVEPADRRTLLRALAWARRGTGGEQCRLRLRNADGPTRHFRLVAQAERDADGKLSGVFGILRDVTEEEAAQAELIRARDAAEAAALAKSNFLATMSHEIRTPMTGVLGMIDLLRSSPTDEDRDRYFATLKQSADLLMAVLDDILDFSRIESGKIEFEERDFDIEELMQSTLDLFDGAASQKGLLLSMDRRGDLTGLVRSDPVRVQQIVSNLLNNAIKFTETGRVTVSLSAAPNERGGQRWRVEVRDTGIGIAPEQIERLFEPFVQAEPGTSRRFGGTGLGLAISRRLVEAMGGEIGVTSRPGRGSTFWFEVDLREGAIAAIEADFTPVASGRRLDILVAEDNPVNQMIISALLRRFGHAVTCVENGRLAVDIALLRRFDCILMDMQMPEMDGLAATRAIRASQGVSADTPIIALTADASPERRRFYNNAGLTDFLTKPIDRKALSDRLVAIGEARRSKAVPTAPPALPTGTCSELLDVARYDELRGALGDAQVRELLDMLVGALGKQPDRIRSMIAQGDYAGARAEAHSLHGAAANVGAIALGRIAEAIEGARDAQPIDEQLDTLDDQARETIKAIASLR